LSYNRVPQIFLGSKNKLWAATEAGLNLISGRGIDGKVEFTTWAENEGLPTGNINSILEDEEGRLWLSDGNGICVFDPEIALSRNGVNPVITTFNMDKGSVEKGFNANLLLKDKNGMIHTRGGNGFSIFDPPSLSPNRQLSNVELTEFWLADNLILPSDSGQNILKNTIGFTDTIQLNYRQHSFSFRVAALGFSQPEKTRFAYRLDGFNTDWTESTEPRIGYTNIGPRTYRLLIKTANSSGLWTDPTQKLAIIISEPP